jgi:lactoylglutathione lyase
MQIDYLALFVSDVERAVQFYRKALGFTFPEEIKPSGTEGQSGPLRIGIYHQDWRPQLLGARGQVPVQGQAFLLSMTVPDLDVAYAGLCQAGVEIWQPPQTMPWGQRVCFFTDPDGNWLELVEAAHKSPVA